MKRYIVRENLRSYRDHWGRVPKISKRIKWEGDEDKDYGSNRQHMHLSRRRRGGAELGNVNFLRRYLQSRCGCLWNDVYSELCASVPSKEEGRALKRLLWWWVERHVYTDSEGVVRHYDRDSPIWDGFFVVDGVLCYYRMPPKAHKKPAPEHFAVDEFHEYNFYYGYWYLTIYKPYVSCYHNSEGILIKTEGKMRDRIHQLTRKQTDWLLGRLPQQKERLTKQGRHLRLRDSHKLRERPQSTPPHSQTEAPRLPREVYTIPYYGCYF